MKNILLILIILTQTIFTAFYQIPSQYITKTGASYSLCKKNTENFKISLNWIDYLRSIGKSPYIYPYLMVSLGAFDFKFNTVETNYALKFGSKMYFSKNLYFDMFYSGRSPYLDFEYQINGMGPILLNGPSPQIILKINIFRDIYEVSIPIELSPGEIALDAIELNDPISFNKGCLSMKTTNKCGKVESNHGLRIKSPDYENGYNLFTDISRSCEIFLNDKKVEKNCNIFNKEIYIENFFSDSYSYQNKIKICGIINPSNSNKKLFSLNFTDKNDNTYAANEFLLKSKKPMAFVLENTFFKNNIINYPFSLEINGYFPLLNNNTKNFQFIIVLPEKFQDKVSNMVVHYFNKNTLENLKFEINSLKNKFTFLVENQDLDIKKGIRLLINGFLIPEEVGKQELLLRVKDNDTGIGIISEFLYDLHIYKEKKKELNVFLTNYDLDSKTSLVIDNTFESDLIPENFDLHFDFTNFNIDRKKFEVTNLKNFHFQTFDLNENKLILKGVSISDNFNYSTKNMKFRLDGFKTHGYDTLNVNIRMKVTKDSTEILQKKVFIQLNPINLRTKNLTYEINSQNQLKLNINFSINKVIESPLYLRLKTSKDLQILNKDLCILNSDLPSFQKNCFLYNQDKNSNFPEIILTKIPKETLENKVYYVELLLKMNDYINSKQNFILDLVHNIDNLKPFILNEVKTSEKIKETINFDCSFGCNKCQVSTSPMKCLSCEEGFIYKFEKCQNFLLNEMTLFPKIEIPSEKSNFDFKINEFFLTLPLLFSLLGYSLFNYLKNKDSMFGGFILGTIYFIEVLGFGTNIYYTNSMNIFIGTFILGWSFFVIYDLYKNSFSDFNLNPRRSFFRIFAILIHVLNFKKFSLLLINDIVNLTFLNLSFKIKDPKKNKHIELPKKNEIIEKNIDFKCCSNKTISSN